VLLMGNLSNPYLSRKGKQPVREADRGWVWDGRESERRPVAGRIRIERKRHHPMRKQADFYLVLLYKRIYRTFEGGKANECSS